MRMQDKLTVRQRAFIEAYAGNATEAVLKAGYSPRTARVQEQRMLLNVAIREAIQERVESTQTGPVVFRWMNEGDVGGGNDA